MIREDPLSETSGEKCGLYLLFHLFLFKLITQEYQYKVVGTERFINHLKHSNSNSKKSPALIG